MLDLQRDPKIVRDKYLKKGKPKGQEKVRESREEIKYMC